MSPRKILIVCSLWFWVAFAACRDEPSAVEKPATIDLFSEENTPWFWVKPDVFKLQLNEPVIHYSSAVTSRIIPMDQLTVDDPGLKEKLIYYGTTGVKDYGDGRWQVQYSKYCHYVKGVVRDFARLEVVKSASTVTSGFGIEDGSPRENGHNYFAPTLRVSLENGLQDVCFADAIHRYAANRGGRMYVFRFSDEPVTDAVSAQVGCYYAGESEVPGTYDIEVGADGYETQHFKNITIVLDENQCHVVKKEIEVTLKKK